MRMQTSLAQTRAFSLILFSLGLFLSSGWAEAKPFDPIDPNHWYPIGEKHVLGSDLIRLESQLPKLEQDKDFFHWTNPAQGTEWAKAGKLSEQTVIDMNTPVPTDLQYFGPGVYVAEDARSSSRFGEFPVLFTFPAGTPIYNQEIVRSHLKPLFGRELNNNELSQLGALIPFIRRLPTPTRDPWWITHHTRNTSRVRYAAGKEGAHYSPVGAVLSQWSATPRKLEALSQIPPEGAARFEDEYLHRLTSAMKAQDLLTFLRSTQVKPEAPGLASHPETFAPFHEFLNLIATQPESQFPPDLQRGDVFFGVYGTWGRMQVEKTLPPLMKALTGQPEYRSQSMSSGREIYVTPLQLNELLNNKYLKVTSRPTEDGMGFWVTYEYPSVKNYQGFVDELSHSLKNELARSNGSPEQNSDLNKKIIKELLIRLFDDKFNHSHYSFKRTFASICPFGEQTSQVARMYDEVLPIWNHDQFVETFPNFWDRALLLLPLPLVERLNQGTLHHYKVLTRALIEEMVDARLKGRMPDYLKNPGFSGLLKPLASLVGKDQVQLNASDWDEIQKGDMMPVLNRHLGQGWEIQSLQDLKAALEPQLVEYRSFLKEQRASIILKVLVETLLLNKHRSRDPDLFREIADLRSIVSPSVGLPLSSEEQKFILDGLAAELSKPLSVPSLQFIREALQSISPDAESRLTPAFIKLVERSPGLFREFEYQWEGLPILQGVLSSSLPLVRTDAVNTWIKFSEHWSQRDWKEQYSYPNHVTALLNHLLNHHEDLRPFVVLPAGMQEQDCAPEAGPGRSEPACAEYLSAKKEEEKFQAGNRKLLFGALDSLKEAWQESHQNSYRTLLNGVLNSKVESVRNLAVEYLNTQTKPSSREWVVSLNAQLKAALHAGEATNGCTNGKLGVE